MMNKTVGKVLGLIVGVGVTLVAVVAASGVANAAEFRSKTYQLKKTVWSAELGACLTITLSGKVEYQRFRAAGDPRAGFAASQRTLVNPRMTVKSWKGPRCRTERSRVPLTAITMKQRWYNYGCNGNLGISIAALPWQVGIQPTVQCGEITAATRSSNSGANNSSYSQANSGRPVRFDGLVYLNTRQKCVAVDATIIAHKGNRSDSFTETFKVCLT